MLWQKEKEEKTMGIINDWDNRFEVPQILMLLERVFNLLQFDVQWDINEEVTDNDWRKMSIDELAERLGEDFKYKMVDEYNDMQESGEWEEFENEIDKEDYNLSIDHLIDEELSDDESDNADE